MRKWRSKAMQVFNLLKFWFKKYVNRCLIINLLREIWDGVISVRETAIPVFGRNYDAGISLNAVYTTYFKLYVMLTFHELCLLVPLCGSGCLLPVNILACDNNNKKMSSVCVTHPVSWLCFNFKVWEQRAVCEIWLQCYVQNKTTSKLYSILAEKKKCQNVQTLHGSQAWWLFIITLECLIQVSDLLLLDRSLY